MGHGLLLLSAVLHDGPGKGDASVAESGMMHLPGNRGENRC